MQARGRDTDRNPGRRGSLILTGERTAPAAMMSITARTG
jgi:hypothetical protein